MQANARSEFACKNRKMAGKKFEAGNKKKEKIELKTRQKNNRLPIIKRQAIQG